MPWSSASAVPDPYARPTLLWPSTAVVKAQDELARSALTTVLDSQNLPAIRAYGSGTTNLTTAISTLLGSTSHFPWCYGLDFRHLGGWESALSGVLADERLVGRNVDAIDLVVSHIAVDPLNGWSQIAQHGAGLLRNSLKLRRRKRSGSRNLAFDDELWHGCDLSQGNVAKCTCALSAQ